MALCAGRDQNCEYERSLNAQGSNIMMVEHAITDYVIDPRYVTSRVGGWI